MAFSDDLIQAVWEKARQMPDRDMTVWRRDQCGAWLHREQYNNPDSEYGWKIENITPGGPNILDNLQAFHWQNSFDIANGKPHCRVKADRAGLSPHQSVDRPRNTSG